MDDLDHGSCGFFPCPLVGLLYPSSNSCPSERISEKVQVIKLVSTGEPKSLGLQESDHCYGKKRRVGWKSILTHSVSELLTVGFLKVTCSKLTVFL